jgi:hypothetical protein
MPYARRLNRKNTMRRQRLLPATRAPPVAHHVRRPGLFEIARSCLCHLLLVCAVRRRYRWTLARGRAAAEVLCVRC